MSEMYKEMSIETIDINRNDNNLGSDYTDEFNNIKEDSKDKMDDYELFYFPIIFEKQNSLPLAGAGTKDLFSDLWSWVSGCFNFCGCWSIPYEENFKDLSENNKFLEMLLKAEQEAQKIVLRANELKSLQMEFLNKSLDCEMDSFIKDLEERYQQQNKSITKQIDEIAEISKKNNDTEEINNILRKFETRCDTATSFVLGRVVNVDLDCPEEVVKLWGKPKDLLDHNNRHVNKHLRLSQMLKSKDSLITKHGKVFVLHESDNTTKIQLTRHGSFWLKSKHAI